MASAVVPEIIPVLTAELLKSLFLIASRAAIIPSKADLLMPFLFFIPKISINSLLD